MMYDMVMKVTTPARISVLAVVCRWWRPKNRSSMEGF
jgi:hypothetical protein